MGLGFRVWVLELGVQCLGCRGGGLGILGPRVDRAFRALAWC